MPQLPEFDDWKRPWNPGELDEDKIARLVYNARKGEQDAKEKVAAHEATITQLNSDLDAEKARKSEADPEVQEQLKALLKENRELKAKGDSPRPQDQLAIDKLDVALELGLTKSQSARLVGTTRDELLADGKVLAADLGIALPGDEKGGDNAGFDFSAPDPAGVPSRTGMPKGFAVETKSNPAKAAQALPPLGR